MRHLFLLAALGAVATVPRAALAADAPLPTFVAVPPPLALLPAPTAGAGVAAPLAEPESIYHGLYVGTEVFGVGGRGIKGGFGGDVYAGYERLLENGALVGVQGSTGYAPSIFGRAGLRGFDFGEASATLAYPLGRFTPFVAAGLVVARPVVGRDLAGNPTDGFNDLLNGSGSLLAAPRVGVGFSYALTQNLAVSVAVSAGRGLNGAGFP